VLAVLDGVPELAPEPFDAVPDVLDVLAGPPASVGADDAPVAQLATAKSPSVTTVATARQPMRRR